MADPESPNSSFSNGRRWLNWLNSLLAALAVLALVVMVNYLAGGHFARFEMDRDSSFKLSDQTINVLNNLTNDVYVTIFFQPHGDNEEMYGLVSGLLTEYEETCPRHIHVRRIDYNRDIGPAKEFLTKYNLADVKAKDFVFFDCGGHTKLINGKDLANYDISDFVAGRSKFIRRSSFLGELYFTSDIYDITHPHHSKVYFLTGHGENDPDDDKSPSGYSKLAAIITNEIDCDYAKLSLAGTNIIPADCSLLIVPASARELRMAPAELGKISSYLKHGGRLFALLTVSSGLETVLSNWGVGLSDSDPRLGRIVDLDPSYKLPAAGTFLTAQIFSHAITQSLANEQSAVPLLMLLPRAVFQLENQSKSPGAPEVTPLAATSPQGTAGSGPYKQTGVFGLLAAVEQQGVNGSGARLVVAGDSDFLDDQVIDTAGNHRFASKAISWLLQSPQIMLEGLGPRPIKEYRLYMTQSQESAIRWLFLAGLPGGVLCLGGLVWLRRRS